MSDLPLQRCFPPVVSSATKLLVLGSLPGVQSLAAGRYYAHPQNQFWRLMGAVVEHDLPGLSYDARLDALLAAGVGLWDTVAAAERPGSLDTDIRLHEASDLRGLVAELPRLRAVGFNGGTSSRIGRRALGESQLALIDLPSSSPAYTLPFRSKVDRWQELRRFL